LTINSTQDYHDKITDLYDVYYKANKDESPTVSERNSASNALIEAYVVEHGKRPPNAITSRLATYILLDDLTDSHPDKMAREEYPIMSYGQTGRYFARNGQLSDEPFSQESVVGHVKELDGKGDEVSSALLNPETDEQRAEVWRLFLREVLTEREVVVIESYYSDGDSQAVIAERLGVSQPRIAHILRQSLDKLRKLTL